MLLAGAGMLVAALIALQATNTSYDMRQVMAVDVPPLSVGLLEAKDVGFYQEVTRRIGEQPGVEGVALGSFVPWRDAGTWPRFQFTVEGYTPVDGEESPHAGLRFVGPGFFSVLGIPVVAGREFTTDDRMDGEPVVVVSQSIAQRLFLDGDALNRRLSWTGPPFCKPRPCRIVGIVADVDDENVVRSPAMTIYQPVLQNGLVSRLFVRTSGDPYALVPTVTRIIRGLSPTQAVERAATLEDVRAKVLAPERLNAFVICGFAGIALLIAVVGVSGVLAFSVSARTREFGVRLALGAAPSRLLGGVLSEGARIVFAGILAGAAGGYAFARIAASHLENVRVPGALPILAAAAVLAVAAVVGSLVPAARAAHVDVLQALRSE